VALPLKPPVSPQLALSRKTLPTEEGWAYEPKYDGFRALAFVDGERVYLQSRNGRPLARYFPELRFPEGRYVIDGELVITDADGREEFDALQNRIHPAESRIRMLSVSTPAVHRVFDVLVCDGAKLLAKPFTERRDALERWIEERDDPGSLELTPLAREAADAEPWLAGGEKRLRTADCVIVGWRPGKEDGTVGSLILGLYDDGKLRVVGHTSGLRAKEKRELRARLAPYETGERGSADPSRWAHDRELEWIGLRPELVIEVTFDHVSADRIRHGAKILRWREDKDPRDCTFDQLYA
jgi:ATP-dependent DNA ligase